MIDFKVEDQIENPLVWCDATKLQQVLVNVLNNAVKFTPAEERSHLAASRE